MIDLHCHILPGVDDGSKSMEETIKILKEAKNAGFDTICFTPHYVEPNYLNTKTQNYEILKQVEKRLEEENIQVKLLLGNEIFIHENMNELLESKTISTLADSNYALIELPMYQELPQQVVQKMFDTVKKNGFKIVIAHPERYTYIQKNPKKILEYFDNDVLFQGNYASILGAYGRDAQKTMKKLLKDKVIHFLATDVHHINRCFYEEFDAIKKKLLKVIDKGYFEIITEINPRLVIENKEVIKYGGK